MGKQPAPSPRAGAVADALARPQQAAVGDLALARRLTAFASELLAEAFQRDEIVDGASEHGRRAVRDR